MTENVKIALLEGIPASKIMNDGMILAMSEVGRLFEAGEYYVPEMLVAARAMQAGMDVLKPYLTSSEAHPAGKDCHRYCERGFSRYWQEPGQDDVRRIRV